MENAQKHINLIMDFIKRSEENTTMDTQTKSILDKLTADISNDETKRSAFCYLILSKMCDNGLESKCHIDTLKAILMYMDIRLPEIEDSSNIIRRCLYTNNISLVCMLIKEGYRFKSDGNIVRQAVYANKLEIALLLINAGYNVPGNISIFSISNQLSWDPVRLKFLLDNGSKLDISDKERECISIIYDAICNNLESTELES